MTIGELTYSLGATWDKKSLGDIKGGLENIAKGFTASIGIISGALGAMFASSKQFAEINDELGKMARNRDIAIDSYEALKYSFEGAGVAGDKVQDVLKELQEAKGKFAQGKGDVEAFAILGIDPNSFKTNEELFYATVDSLNQIRDKNLQSELSKRIFKNQDLANLIDGGSEAIRQQKKELEELGILVSKQDYQNSANFNDTLLKTMTILNGYAKKVFSELMPIFTNLMKSFNSFLKANGALIRSGLRKFLDYLISGSKFFIDLLSRVINHLGGVKTVAIAVGAILAIWQLPLLIAIGSVVALMLAFDDFMNFIKGQDSVIGDFVDSIKISFEVLKKEFPTLGAIAQAGIDNILASFIFLKDSLSNLWALITGELSFSEYFKENIAISKTFASDIIESFVTMYNSIMSNFPNLKALFDNSFKLVLGVFENFKQNIFTLWDLITGKLDFVTFLESQISKIGTILDSIIEMFTKAFSSIGEEIKNSLKSIPFVDDVFKFFGSSTTVVQNQQPQAVTIPANPNNPNNITNNYNINANVNANSKNVGDVIKEINHPSGY